MPQATHRTSVLAVLAMLLATPLAALAQTAPAGVVTALQGRATVVRTATTGPAPLKFKDDVFVHDRIRTGDRSLVRLLLGGRATVTVRERCVLTITEYPSVSQVHIGTGRASVAAVKSRMRPGETIDIVTPHAQATIRGTVVIAEVTGNESTFTVIRGLVDVSALDPTSRRPAGVVLHVGALEQVTVSAGGTTRSQTLTPAEARQLAEQFAVSPRAAPVAAHESLGDVHVRAAIEDLANVAGSRPGVLADANRGADLTGGVAAVAVPATTSSQPVSAATSPVVTTTTGAVGSVLTTTTGTVGSVLTTTTGTVGSVLTTATGTVGSALTTTTTAVAPVTSAVAPGVTSTVAPVVSTTTTLVNTVTSQPVAPTTTQDPLGTASTLTQGLLGK